MAEPYATPRRFPRVKLLGNVTGGVSFLHDVALLDLGEGGARLEHAWRFSLNAICFLRLPAPEGELVLKAKVVHSAVSRTVPGPGEGSTLLFQSGVEFVGLTSDALLVGSSSPGSGRASHPPSRYHFPGVSQCSGR